MAKVPAPEVQIPEGSMHAGDFYDMAMKRGANQLSNEKEWYGRVTGRLRSVEHQDKALVILDDVRGPKYGGTAAIISLNKERREALGKLREGDIVTVNGYLATRIVSIGFATLDMAELVTESRQLETNR